MNDGSKDRIDDRLAVLRRAYAGKLPCKVDAVTSAWTERRAREEVARLAHQLAGTAGSYGFAGVHDKARAVLDAARDEGGGEDAVSEAISALDREVRDLDM